MYLKDDGKLYIKNASNTEVALLTGTGAMPTVASGKVGIGTASPAEILTLDSPSNTRLLLRESGANKGQVSAGGSGLYFQNLAGDIHFRNVADGGTMIIKDSGKVGIGTTVPSEMLSVAGAVSATTTAKAWARWDGTGGGHAEVAGATYNVSSIAYNGTGNFTVNLTTPSGFGNGMCVVGSAGDSNYSSADTNLNFRHDVSSDSAIDVIIATDAGADHSDCDQICLVAFNTQ